jgi:hypothetical protein
VLVFIAHGRRELVHLAVTAHPTAAWAWRQLVEATAWGRRPKHLLRDRDRVYGGAFRDRATALGIETILSRVRAPRANAVAERVIGTLRRECLDHVIPVDERHLRAILAEYVGYYNRDRRSARTTAPPERRPLAADQRLVPAQQGLGADGQPVPLAARQPTAQRRAHQPVAVAPGRALGGPAQHPHLVAQRPYLDCLRPRRPRPWQVASQEEAEERVEDRPEHPRSVAARAPIACPGFRTPHLDGARTDVL